VNGVKTRVDVLYELFQRADLVTYEQAAEALGLDPIQDRKAIRDTMGRVRRKLLARDGRALRSVPDVGYRIAEPNEHITLYRERKKRGTNQLVTGRDELKGTDLSSLTQEGRDAVLAESVAASRIIDFIVSTDRRLRKQEAKIDEIKGEVTRNAEESAEIKKRLTQLEQPG
jgi:hypothetical protein